VFLLLQSNDKAAVAKRSFQRKHPPYSQQPVCLIPRPTIDLHMQAYSHASNQTVIIQAYLPIYTDITHTIPTATPMVQNLLLGLAVECTPLNPRTKRPVGYTMDSYVFAAEFYGIVTAIYWIFSTKRRTSVIITDSLSALQAIQNVSWKKNPLINRACLLYSNLCWFHD